MSADKPKGPKPFLGDEELSAELDAWDATFDALHLEDGGPPADQPVMDWPAPDPAARVPEPALVAGDSSHTLDEFVPTFEGRAETDVADPDDSTFDRPLPGGDETDFSEIGAGQAPAALGDMLGRPGTLPPIEEEGETRITSVESRRRPTQPRNAVSEADIEVEEEDVYTSASRPNVPPAEHDFSDFSDEPIAPPPPRPSTPTLPPPIAAPRTMTRGPAIIRRTPVSMAAVKPPPGYEDASESDFGGSTKIASVEEIEQRAQESRRMEARQKAPTAPPPMMMEPEEEDFPDIEIGGDGSDAAAAAPAADPAPAPRRTVAHVVRRTPAAGVSVKRQTGAVPVVEAVIPPSGPVPRELDSEDDFSDVAAAVGATEDLPVAPRTTTARGESERGRTTQADDDQPHVIGANDLDDAIDDSLETFAPRDVHDLPTPNPDALAAKPAVADFYPRVKTPTSFPPLGGFAEAPQSEALDEDPATTLLGMGRTGSPRPIRLDTSLADYSSTTPEIEPSIDLDALGGETPWPEQLAPLPTSQLDEDFASWLLVYEREVATVDDSVASAALRIEAGRLSERLGDNDRARSHYDAALLADPRATSALRGLRRIARASGDLVEATRHLESEIAVAGALERRPLGHYRVDLLMASGEQDLARVAAGEILDNAPSDVRALLAQLELAFLDGRADEFGTALEQLAHAVTDPELRAAVQSARAVLAAHHNDLTGAATWFGAAAESDPGSLGARLGAIRQAAQQTDGEVSARSFLELARQIETTDPLTAAALAVRAQHWSQGEAGATAAQLAIQLTPQEPLVARVAAESRGDAFSYSHWATTPAASAERAYAAGQAAELDPTRGAELWNSVLELDPGDDYAAAQLRTAYVAAEATQLAIGVDQAVAADVQRDRARLRAAFGMIGQGELEGAIELLRTAHAQRPDALALTEALAEALAAAGRWTERAQLLAELAADPGEQLDREVALLRSALAWEEAVGAASEAADPELQNITASALAAWERVLERPSSTERTPAAPAAHAAAIVLASRLGDREALGEVLRRAQAAERTPAAAASLALRRARLVAGEDPARAEAILRELATGHELDPRLTAWRVLGAARRNDLADAATALEERANHLGKGSEVAALRLRAAQLALDAGDGARATSLLRDVETALPTLAILPDLIAAARRRSGERSSGPHTRVRRDTPPPTGAAIGDEFARLVRDADLAASQNDGGTALALYQQALELRPGDPLATVPLIRVATQLREPSPIAALALAHLRASEAAEDGTQKAEAYELLALIDKELRSDAPSAQIALESASQADPSRIDLMFRLEREYAVADNIQELLRLRRAELDQIPAEFAHDRAAMLMDTAVLAERDQRPDLELTELYRAALACDAKRRMALLYLESILRRAGASRELAQLEDQIAAYFDGDSRTQAAFFTRAGETLAEIGQIDAAVQKFGKAEEVLPGHVPALEGWRNAALKGQLWIDVAEAATRQANVTPELDLRAKLHHFAGVALMDKALNTEQAQAALRRALEADPGHRDAFLRLRILLEEDARQDELAILLSNRLEHETDPTARIELHRATAELHRNFLDDRETAKRHYREILNADPNDLRAHSAIADIAWEQGNWQEAADALISLARLQHDPGTLTRLCVRLGTIYADRLNEPAMALKAFQRALTYQPEDEASLTRIADLATQSGEWKLALGACERLVKSAQEPDKRVAHLHRVAKIFRLGFNDNKRAERALNLALDGSPTNDEALSHLVQFYRDAGDMTSVRVHLNRVVGTMRARVAQDPKDGVAYRVIARAMTARHHAGVDGSIPIARAAAEIAQLLDAAGDPERLLLDEVPRTDLSLLIRPEADEVLFPRGVQPELRQVFTLLGDRVAKHVGVDTRVYGVGRGDRLRARDHAVAGQAQDVASGLGFGEIDVYVSAKLPFAMVAEPTSPVSLVLGSAIAQGDPRGVRFAAGSALKLAQASLAIPARLAPDDLGVLVVALMRLFQAEFPMLGLPEDAVTTQMQKLKRLIPTGLSNEIRPFALAVDAQHFHHQTLARDLKIAGLRAGLVASGSLLAGLSLLAAAAETDVQTFLADPVAQGLLSFALAEDHAAVAR
jgi:tetratricopeptide (TPR) repeat protein